MIVAQFSTCDSPVEKLFCWFIIVTLSDKCYFEKIQNVKKYRMGCC